jgi:hypothetical protein
MAQSKKDAVCLIVVEGGDGGPKGDMREVGESKGAEEPSSFPVLVPRQIRHLKRVTGGVYD